MSLLRALREPVRELRPRYAALPLIPLPTYALSSAGRGDLRVEHVGVLVLDGVRTAGAVA